MEGFADAPSLRVFRTGRTLGYWVDISRKFRGSACDENIRGGVAEARHRKSCQESLRRFSGRYAEGSRAEVLLLTRNLSTQFLTARVVSETQAYICNRFSGRLGETARSWPEAFAAGAAGPIWIDGARHRGFLHHLYSHFCRGGCVCAREIVASQTASA